MVAGHDDGDDNISDRRSSSLASTWSDENRLNMERWTVAGVERCRASRADTAKGVWPHLATMAGQRMSAETKATRAVVYAKGVQVPEPDMNTREHERFVAKPSPNARAIPRGVRGEKGCGRCV